jgi:betaine-aldehyde dehydrogenase
MKTATKPSSAVKTYDMLVDGKLVQARSAKTRDIFDPASGELLARVPEGDRADAKAAVLAARKAFDQGPWRKTSAQDRGKLLIKLGEELRARAKELAELEVRNMGKPLAEAEFDVADAANCFEFYGGLATKIHGETMNVPANSLSFVLREPVGVCGQIIPWNYPLLMAAWKLAPALAAGCTVVLKPSELTPLTALELAKLLKDVFPAGVVNVLSGPGAGCGEELAESALVDKVAFTGGTVTGRKIAQAATGNLKKVTLELGGKNPNIVFADADFEAAVDGALFAAFANQGEVCSAGSRLLVEKKVHKKLVDAMVAKAPRIVLGHGLTKGVKMGPLVSAAHREKVESYIAIGKKEGAKLVCGGGRPKGKEFEKGNFVEPTIFDDVKPSMRIAREEIFGPVLSVIPFETEEEAIRIANDSEYGLAAGVWTLNVNRGIRVLKELRAGITWLNTYHPTFNEMPWGGYKQSGYGRELGLYGIEAYLETKQVNVNLDEAPLGWY